MKVLKVIGIILLVLFVGLAIVNTIAGTDYDVSRSVEIETPASYPYAMVSDLRNWELWSPWKAKDPDMKMEYGETTSGVGAWYSWDGPISKQGKLTVVSAEENKSMESAIDFGDMGQSNGYWRFEENEGKTTVTWGFKGEMPWLFAFFNLTMESAVSEDFDSGLNKIKALAEENFANMPQVAVEVVEVTSMPFFGIKESLNMDDISNSDTYASHFGELGTFLGAENMSTMLGNPFVIFYTWDEENRTTDVEFCFPSSADLEGNDRITTGMTHGGKALKAVKSGDYNTKAEHEAMYAYAQANGLEVGSPWEVYGDPETQGTYVEVYYPVLSE